MHDHRIRPRLPGGNKTTADNSSRHRSRQKNGSSLFSVGGRNPEFAGVAEAADTGFRIRVQRN
jgi:hypothetical protein